MLDGRAENNEALYAMMQDRMRQPTHPIREMNTVRYMTNDYRVVIGENISREGFCGLVYDSFKAAVEWGALRELLEKERPLSIDYGAERVHWKVNWTPWHAANKVITASKGKYAKDLLPIITSLGIAEDEITEESKNGIVFVLLTACADWRIHDFGTGCASQTRGWNTTHEGREKGYAACKAQLNELRLQPGPQALRREIMFITQVMGMITNYNPF